MKKQVLHIGQQSVYNYDPWEKGTHKRNTTKMKYLILIGREMKYLILVGKEDPKSLEVLMRWRYRSGFREAKEARICKAEYETGNYTEKKRQKFARDPFWVFH